MKTGLILTIGSLGFMSLLLISYYLQQRPASLGSKLYRIMMITVIVFVATEIISYAYYFIGNCPDFLKLLFLRIHWLAGIAYYTMFYMYALCFFKDLKAATVMELIKTDKRCTLFLAFSIVFSVDFCFFPFDDMTAETFSFVPGLPAYTMMIYGFVMVVIITILLFRENKNIYFDIIRSIFVFIVLMAIIYPMQLFFPNVSFLGLFSVLHMYFLYFYIENPDLKMIPLVEKLKKDVERSSLAKTDFLSNMSHEIRSPMNAIVGFSETILSNPVFDADSIRTDVMHIATAGNNLLDIINNILDISKIESGNETLEEKEYSVGNVVMELASIIESRLDNKPIKLVTEVDTQIPKKLYGDSTKLFQVLLNVLTNSVKYTEVGKIRLTLAKAIKGNNVTLKFRISDTGYGIKKEDYDKLFEKFSRLTSATTNEIEGTGLGLVITKKYVDLLGGKIWFESDYGVGTIFYVEVTQRIVDPTPLGSIRETHYSENSVDYLDCTGKRALVVDDNLLNIKVAKRILSKYNFTIDSVNSGKECVYKIKEGQQYDIIFLDHMMPEMDGIEVVHILRKLEGFNIPPVVALTANAITGVKDMYLNEGFDEYLSKPINVVELNHLIDRYFGGKK